MATMFIDVAAVLATTGLIVYLLYALVQPEKF
jgi:K+-transporting ATPase KdpF subunit